MAKTSKVEGVSVYLEAKLHSLPILSYTSTNLQNVKEPIVINKISAAKIIEKFSMKYCQNFLTGISGRWLADLKKRDKNNKIIQKILNWEVF